MVAVVSDASPLNYLIWIERDFVLQQLYERVLIPDIVISELTHPASPEPVKRWIENRPTWAEVRKASPDYSVELELLDPGERAAIQLASEENAGLLLMDERVGARVARNRGLMVTGTLGVLLEAADRRLIDLESALAALQTTAFRFTPQLFAEIRRRARQVHPSGDLH